VATPTYGALDHFGEILDSALSIFNDLFADGEADTGAFKIIPTMQPLKNNEDLLRV
jgi:hypothetical protein